MKKINLIYNDKGYISNTFDDSEFYIAQQEDKAVIINATFPGNLVGSVNAYVKSGSGGDVIENCGAIDINKHTVELALDSKYLAYNYLKVGFEVKTSTKEIRFEPLTLEVDEFVNVTGSSAPSPYTVSVRVGSITHLEPDEEPTITNTGTDKHLVLNFGIPKGETGETGPQGPQGEIGPQGETGPQGEQGIQGPKGDPGYTPVKGVDYFTEDDMDSELSEKSTNPVQNKVITEELNSRIKYMADSDIPEWWYERENCWRDITEPGLYHVKLSIDGMGDCTSALLIVGQDGQGDPTRPTQMLIGYNMCMYREYDTDICSWTLWEDLWGSASMVESLRLRIHKLEGNVRDINENASNLDEGLNIIKNDIENIETNKANAIENSASGENIQLTDSADSILKGLNIYGKTEQVQTTGKNMLDMNNTEASNGIAFEFADSVMKATTINGNGAIRYEIGNYADFVGKTLTLSFDYLDLSSASTGTSFNTFIQADNTEIIRNSTAKGSKGTIPFTVPENDTAEKLVVRMYVGYVLQNAGEYIKLGNILLAEGTDQEYEPYSGGFASPSPDWSQPLNSVGDKGNVGLSVSGKNLASHFIKGIGMNFTTGAETINAEYATTDYIPVSYNANSTYYLSNLLANLNSCVFAYNKDKVFLGRIGGSSGRTNIALKNTDFTSGTPQGTGDIAYLRITQYYVSGTSTGSIDDIENAKVQLELGNFSEYEPYKIPQSLNISTPNGLPGIPVTDGGNYIDSNGQQRVCDEIVSERDVYVKRAEKYIFDGSESVTDQSGNFPADNTYLFAINLGTKINRKTMGGYTANFEMCNYFSNAQQNIQTKYEKEAFVFNPGSSYANYIYFRVFKSRFASETPVNEFKQMLVDWYASGNPMVVNYILAEPIETPLTEEQISAYKSIHTSKPTTNITNDESAYMKVDYAVDTKTYIDNKIDNKFAELQNAILSTGGNV